MTKETYIYGGAFNPPTIAHQEVVRALVDKAAECDAEVWIMPSGNRADKSIKESRDRRLALLDAMLQDVVTAVPVQVCTLELDTPRPTQTIETDQQLSRLYPDRSFRWVFGVDSVNTMPEWHRGDELLQRLPMIVVDRAGYKLKQQPQDYETMQIALPQVSSSVVRECMSAGRDIRSMVPDAVATLLVKTQAV